MIKTINAKRATVGAGVLEPVRTSQNLQIAINNSDHLTIIEPKLPILHQCLDASTKQGQNAISSAALYDVQTIFYIENLEALGFQIFSRILIEDGELSFHFGRIADPMIVGHSWSPIDKSTRDCYLGVLLNTGEVLVLKRDSLDASNYSVHFRSFTSLLDQMRLPPERLTLEGDIILSRKQFEELKITDYLFGQNQQGNMVLSLAHESGEVTLHALAEGLSLKQRFEAGGHVVKLCFSDTHFYYVLNDNSVWECELNSEETAKSLPVQLKGALRFLVSQLRSEGEYLFVADTTSLSAFKLGTLVTSIALPFRTVIVSLNALRIENALKLLLSYESSQFCVADFDGNRLELYTDITGWKTYVNKILLRQQLVAAKEQSKAPSKVFQPYLNDSVEFNFANFGTNILVGTGLIATVYCLSPHNVINNVIKSKMEFNVSFTPVSDILLNTANIEIPNKLTSSITDLNSFYIRTGSQLLSLPKTSNGASESAPADFINSVKSWKATLFDYTLDGVKKLPIEERSSLELSLQANFRDHQKIKSLQERYTFNVMFERTLKALSSTGGLSNELSNELLELASEQDAIGHIIRVHLALIILTYANSAGSSEFSTPFDRFMLLTYYLLLKHNGVEFSSKSLPQTATCTISTDLCTESFQVSKDDVPDVDFLKFAVSTTDHRWPRCDMTFLPILNLINKSDELEHHNYLIPTDIDSSLVEALFKVIDYCIYTGNRTFNIRVGV